MMSMACVIQIRCLDGSFLAEPGLDISSYSTALR